MRLPLLVQKTLAWICGVSIVIATFPYPSSASPGPASAMIGTMSAAGVVEVRGLKTKEATLFSGDRVRSFDSSYAKVFLNQGHRIELSSNSDVTLTGEKDLTKIAMLSGWVGFTSSPARPLQLEVQSLVVTAQPGQSGSVSSVEENVVSIAAVKGQIKVSNRTTGEAFLLQPGTSTVFGLSGREPVQTASTGNPAVARPQSLQSQLQQQSTTQQQPPAQQPPDQQTATVKIPPSSGGGKAFPTKVLVIAGIAGAAVAVAAVAAGGGDDEVASPSTPR